MCTICAYQQLPQAILGSAVVRFCVWCPEGAFERDYNTCKLLLEVLYVCVCDSLRGCVSVTTIPVSYYRKCCSKCVCVCGRCPEGACVCVII